MNTSYSSITDRISDITKELEALTLAAHQINLSQSPKVKQTFVQGLTEILEAKSQTSYDVLMDKLAQQFPAISRKSIQSQLSFNTKEGNVVRHFVGTTKFYSIGTKQRRVNKYSYPRHGGSDYAKGGISGIKNQFPKIYQFINELKKPLTSKQAFDQFVKKFPEMKGRKTSFDSNLSALANEGAIGRTKNMMTDDNSSVQSKYHWGSVELINSVK